MLACQSHIHEWLASRLQDRDELHFPCQYNKACSMSSIERKCWTNVYVCKETAKPIVTSLHEHTRSPRARMPTYTALLKWGVSSMTPPPLLAKLIADFHECRAGLCMCVRPSVWAYCQNTCKREKGGEKECRGPNRTQRNITPGWRPRITAVESAEQPLSEGHFWKNFCQHHQT